MPRRHGATTHDDVAIRHVRVHHPDGPDGGDADPREAVGPADRGTRGRHLDTVAHHSVQPDVHEPRHQLHPVLAERATLPPRAETYVAVWPWWCKHGVIRCHAQHRNNGDNYIGEQAGEQLVIDRYKDLVSYRTPSYVFITRSNQI